MGLEGMDKSTVSRLAGVLDDEVRAFRERPLPAACPYLWLDATFPKVREDGRVVTMALMIAVGVTDQGQRTVLGVDLGRTEDGTHWRAFLRSLRDRGLHGVSLVISDDHKGLRSAVDSEFLGSSWQRCTVHFTRNAVAQVSKPAQPIVSAAIRQVLAQPDRQAAEAQVQRSILALQPRFPKVADMLAQAEPDLLAHMDFPTAHWRQLRSTNGLERLNREVARRIDVVGIFPHRDSGASRARSWPSRTTSGPPPAATSASSPCPPSGRTRPRPCPSPNMRSPRRQRGAARGVRQWHSFPNTLQEIRWILHHLDRLDLAAPSPWPPFPHRRHDPRRLTIRARPHPAVLRRPAHRRGHFPCPPAARRGPTSPVTPSPASRSPPSPAHPVHDFAVNVTHPVPAGAGIRLRWCACGADREAPDPRPRPGMRAAAGRIPRRLWPLAPSSP